MTWKALLEKSLNKENRKQLWTNLACLAEKKLERSWKLSLTKNASQALPCKELNSLKFTRHDREIPIIRPRTFATTFKSAQTNKKLNFLNFLCYFCGRLNIWELDCSIFFHSSRTVLVESRRGRRDEWTTLKERKARMKRFLFKAKRTIRDEIWDVEKAECGTQST